MTAEGEAEPISGSMNSRVIDTRKGLIRHDDLDEETLAQILRLLSALRDWRAAEQRLSFASRSALKLNDTDMKALRYVTASLNAGITVTAGALAENLHISTASTTKLLDRLERANHVLRKPHPTDRRAVTVEITAQTYRQLHASAERQQALKFEIARALSPDDRETVIRFLTDLTNATTISAALEG
jgi:DNA-binding MarR family transcriptional regulator